MNEIEIVENKKQCLFAYKNDNLLFYSTIDFKWTKKNLVKIFDKNDNLILEIQSYDAPFRSPKFKILSQKNLKGKNIREITTDFISFDNDKTLSRHRDDFFSLNQNYSHFFNQIKIAETKQKAWNSLQKINLNVDEKYLDFQDLIIIHDLVVRTGYNSD